MISYIKLEFQDEFGKTISAGIYNKTGKPIVSYSKNVEAQNITNNVLDVIKKNLSSKKQLYKI